MRELPARAWAFLLSLALAASLVVWWLSRTRPVAVSLVAFGVLFLVAEIFPFRIRDAHFSVSYVVGVAALIALGPAAAAIAAMFGGVATVVTDPPKRWLSRIIFNSSQFAFAAGISGAAYVHSGGPVGH